MWSAMKFKFGDRVVAKDFLDNGDVAGEVVRVYDDGLTGYGVIFDNLKGPFGDGGVFMEENELQYEEEL